MLLCMTRILSSQAAGRDLGHPSTTTGCHETEATRQQCSNPSHQVTDMRTLTKLLLTFLQECSWRHCLWSGSWQAFSNAQSSPGKYGAGFPRPPPIQETNNNQKLCYVVSGYGSNVPRWYDHHCCLLWWWISPPLLVKCHISNRKTDFLSSLTQLL